MVWYSTTYGLLPVPDSVFGRAERRSAFCRPLKAGLSNGTSSAFVAYSAHVRRRDNVESFKVPFHASCEAGLFLAGETGTGGRDAFGIAFFGRLGDQLLCVGHGKFRGAAEKRRSTKQERASKSAFYCIASNAAERSATTATYTCCLIASLRSAEVAPPAAADFPVNELRSIAYE